MSHRFPFVLFVSFVVKDLYKINRPSRLRRAILFDLSYSSTCKASPNDIGIVIIIIIGEEIIVEHCFADYSTKFPSVFQFGWTFGFLVHFK